MLGAERAGGEGEAGEPIERRPRRCCSRHGRKRRDTEAAVGAADKSAEAPTELAARTRPRSHERKSPEDEPEVFESDTLVDDGLGDEGLALEEGEEGEGQRSPRLGFRGIPTWEEAVGMIVNNNIEMRAKRPSSGAPHGRGQRGSRESRGGDNRGGRGGRGGKRRPS